jgi:hypothetical protein
VAAVTITNLTTEAILIQELYKQIPAGGSIVVDRYRDDLHSMPRLQELWDDGKVSVTVVSDTPEDLFIRNKLHKEGGTLLASDPPAGQAAYTTNLTASPNTFIRVDAENNSIDVDLPDAATNPDATIVIKNVADTNFLVNIVGAGSDTVDGVSTFSAKGLFGVQLRSDGISNWMIY